MSVRSNNGKQMVLVSVDAHMYKQCLGKKKIKRVQPYDPNGSQTKGGNSV